MKDKIGNPAKSATVVDAAKRDVADKIVAAILYNEHGEFTKTEVQEILHMAKASLEKVYGQRFS